MRNSVLVTSDLKSMVVIDPRQDQHLNIGKRGVLLSVLGNDICASQVPAELDSHLSGLLNNKDAFYEFPVADAEKNQLCVTYNEANNTIFIIGITDVIVGFAGPETVDKNKVKTFGVKLKRSPSSGLQAGHVVLARLEGRTGSQKKIAFYHLDQNR